MLPIYKDPDTDEWYYYSDGADVGPFKSFDEAAASWAQMLGGCKDGSCES